MKYGKDQLVKGVLWSGIDKLGVVVIQILLEVILARHLLPADYGIIGMATIFIVLGSLFSESGFSNALIQKQDRTETDFATAFYFNILVSVCFVAAVFVGAPYVANFFNTPALTGVLRVVSLSVIFNALVMVHKTKLSLALDFKKQARISFISLLLSGIIGVYLAVKGFGVWALVAQLLTQNIATVLLFNVFVPWWPAGHFSKRSFSSLIGFGSNLLFAGLLQNLYINLYSALIGRRLSVSSLGLYTKANQFTFMPSSLISGILQRVLFPYFSSVQGENDRIFRLNIDFTRIVCLLVFPVFVYLIIFAEPLVYYGLSVRWLPMVPIIQILAAAYCFQPIIVNNMSVFQVKSKTGLFFRIELLTKVIGIIILYFTISRGIVILSFGLLCQLFIQFLITSFFANAVLQKSMLQQFYVIIPYIMFAAGIWYLSGFLFNYLELGQSWLVGTLLFVSCYGLFYLAFYKTHIRALYKMFTGSKKPKES